MNKFKSLKSRIFITETRSVIFDGVDYIERVITTSDYPGHVLFGYNCQRSLFTYTLKVSKRWSYLNCFKIYTKDPVHRAYAYEYLKNFIQPYNRKNNPQCLPL